MNTILTPITNRGRKLTSPNTICNTWGQGWTNPRKKVARITEFCTGVPIICGFSVWDWFHVIPLVPKISGWILDPFLREAVLAPQRCSLKTLWDLPVGPKNAKHEAVKERRAVWGMRCSLTPSVCGNLNFLFQGAFQRTCEKNSSDPRLIGKQWAGQDTNIEDALFYRRRFWYLTLKISWPLLRQHIYYNITLWGFCVESYSTCVYAYIYIYVCVCVCVCVCMCIYIYIHFQSFVRYETRRNCPIHKFKQSKKNSNPQ